MRHAYLIIAHNQFDLLQQLVSLLDDERNTLFIHIDKKVSELPSIYSSYATVHFVKNRVDVRWGDYSQIACELSLFQEALDDNVNYLYYHLISGTHLPLYGQEYIHNFYDTYQGKEFLVKLETTDYQTTLKVRKYNFFTKNFAHSNKNIARLNQILWRIIHRIQDKFGISKNANIQFSYASNWISLTQGAVAYILSEKEYIRKVFSDSLCGDEYFVPTILNNSDYEWDIVYTDKLLKQEIGDANARTFTLKDYVSLEDSKCLFARKFSESDKELIQKIVELVKIRS